MPFTCALEQGRLIVEPSAERTYLVVGSRTDRAFTSCAAPGSKRCRTFMIHRFEIACLGGRASWAEVAALLPTPFAERMWIENGRLNLDLVAGSAVPAAKPCARPSTRLLDAAGPSHVLAPVNTVCSETSATGQIQHIVLPAGYAPVGELGARLVVPGGAAPQTSAGAEREPLRVRFDPEPKSVAERVVIAEALPPLETGAVQTVAVVAQEQQSAWTATVIRAEQDVGGPAIDVLAATLSLMLLGAAGGWLAFTRSFGIVAPMMQRGRASVNAWREAFAHAASRVRLSRRRPDFADESLANAAEAVEALLGQCQVTVDGLTNAGPLQDVLRQELRALSQRLDAIKASTGDGGEPGRRAGPLFRVMIREIERIRRIADGAAQSLGSIGRDGTAIPRTVSEAYEVLGVNPSVSESVLKKIADALRMSWHPDHASDEDDRRLREDRIKQINIAWELINGKRRAG